MEARCDCGSIAADQGMAVCPCPLKGAGGVDKARHDEECPKERDGNGLPCRGGWLQAACLSTRLRSPVTARPALRLW